jgi:hypothetical protein
VKAERFPGFDVLAQRRYWDPVTAGVVLERLGPRTTVSFFTDDEVAIARPMLDLLVGQERDDDPRVDVLDLIDVRLARGETDGWRYEEMPEDGEAWRRTLAWLDEEAQATFKRPFAHLVTAEQQQLIQGVQDLSQDGKNWHDYPAKHVWSLWTRYASTAFYSHPYAWNEMGFDGPAYPRGYTGLGVGKLDSWEVHDRGEPSS